jgi:RecJ-like exonuclease
MSFQKCPICEGSGNVSFLNYQCTVCNGKGIISEINGLPPAEQPPKQERFCDIVRFTLNQRMKDPQITIEEIEKLWENKN